MWRNWRKKVLKTFFQKEEKSLSSFLNFQEKGVKGVEKENSLSADYG